MEGRWQLGAAGRTGAWLIPVAFLFCCASLWADAGERLETVRKLFEDQQWDAVAKETHQVDAHSPDLSYYRGVAMARLGRWDEAQSALLAGYRLRPDDPRYPVELGGVAFRQKRYAEALKWLRRARRLKPDDRYTADFLATLFFLQGNLGAALRHWNRIEKPGLENVLVEPALRVDPVLLDRAFAFAPLSTLRLSDLLTTQARADALGIFTAYSLRLDARDDGKFDAVFAASERNGWGTFPEAMISTLRGAPYQAVHIEYANLGRSAVNMASLIRWDPDKRRLLSSLSGPWKRNPRYRYGLQVDVRHENWNVLNSNLAALDLRRSAAGGTISAFPSGRWSWSLGGELSHRDYGDVSGAAGITGPFWNGYQLRQTAELSRDLWRVPDRRFENRIRITSEAGRIWSTPSRAFERLQVSVASRWLPRIAGDDYGMRQQVRVGRIFGDAPFDEFFILGLERDNDLWLRAHIGTRDGRKGSAPITRSYFLANWEIDKRLYGNGLLDVKLSPFFDTGKGSRSTWDTAPGKWLCDTGVQAKLSVLGVGFTFTYGKDLRTGANAFYMMAGR